MKSHKDQLHDLRSPRPENARAAPRKAMPNGGIVERLPPDRPWLAASVLIAATALAYLPVIRHGGFVWDDYYNVTNNLLLRSAQGFRHIWTKVGPGLGGTFQYYPLTYSAFWVEYHFWRLQPVGYHLVNVLLHALNAVLVWRLLRRLGVPGAMLAAAIFALHPVHVDSVAWVSEFKNLLSGLFYLLALQCYLRFLGVPEPGPPDSGPPASSCAPAQASGTASEVRPGRPASYFLALFLFLCALAAKTVTVTLPATILLIIWWRTGRIGWRNLLLVAPMLVLAAGAGFVTANVEQHQVRAEGQDWALTPVEHCLLAGRALWFYAGKLIWPGKLIFIYPRWQVSHALWRQYLFPAAAVAAFLTLWMLREKIGRGPLAAALYFAGTLAPALGFVNVYFMRYSYVADHFQYLASLGLITLFAAATTRACLGPGLQAGPGLTKAAMPAAGVALLALGLLTWRQCPIYNNARVWNDTIDKNPSCWMAHNNLGMTLAATGRLKEAAAHYRESLRIRPDNSEAENNLGLALAGEGRMEEAAAHYREALRIKPDYELAHYNWGLALAGEGRLEEAAAHYREALRIKPDYAEAHNNWGMVLAGAGEAEEAVAQYREALRIKPDYVEARNNLGNISFRQGRLREAAEQYQEVLRLTPDNAEVHVNLGLALAGEGGLMEATAQYREALRIKPDSVKAHFNLGLVLARQGLLAEAAAQYRAALLINPEFEPARANLEVLRQKSGKLERQGKTQAF